MTKQSIQQFSTSQASNTDINGINVNTGWPPNNVGIAFRTLMAFLADYAIPISVTCSTPSVTLTATQASAAVITLVGSPGGNVTVTLPSGTLWAGTVANNMTGGFSATLTTGSGSTVTIANGFAAQCQCDGTNVTSYSATLNNLSLSGTLTVGGAANLNGGAVLPNAISLLGKDTSGNNHLLIGYAADNNVYSRAGTGGHLIVTDWTGATTFLDLSGSGPVIPNNVSYLSRDTGGTARSIILFGSDNNVYARAGTAGNFTITNSAGSVSFMAVNSGGATVLGNTVVTANGGTYNISISGNASTATSAGSASSVPWGGISGVPSICYNNGATYGISISGSAGSASSVPWGGISGIPGGVTSYAANMNQNVRTTDSPTFNFVSVSGGFAGSASGWQMTATGTGAFSGTTNSGFVASGLDVFANRFIAASDGRIKQGKRFITAEEGLRFIYEVPPMFYLKEDVSGVVPEAGFIAQDVLAARFPELLLVMDDDEMPISKNGSTGPKGKRYELQQLSTIAYLAAALRNALDRIAVLERRL